MRPRTSFPACPTAVEAGHSGMSPYETSTPSASVSANAPSPLPSTTPILGWTALLVRIKSTAACIRLQQHAGNAGRHKIRHCSRGHRLESEPREIALASRRQRADAADLDRDRTQIREPA